MIKFILNKKVVIADAPAGKTVLDFVRYQRNLTGTKIGCREGDCGACTVLVGDIKKGKLEYQSMTSCLMPLANAHGKHIVTIEGLNLEKLSPVQQAIVDEGGTQCGFCTVGFVVSLSGYVMDKSAPDYEAAIAAIDGNICRCTGYKSLERAAAKICKKLVKKDVKNPIPWLAQQRFLPDYFMPIEKELKALKKALTNPKKNTGKQIVGGGTDLFVQRPEEMHDAMIQPLFDNPALKSITKKGTRCYIGGAATAEDLRSSKVMQRIFPDLQAHMKLVSSTPIRNMGTLAGNIVNASPIGDLTIFFLALDADIDLTKNGKTRTIKLRKLYKGYKKLDRKANEIVESIHFEIPRKTDHFSFEKVCKRTHLDIASVNTAMLVSIKGGKIQEAHLSAGGLAPIPKYLEKSGKYLKGKAINEATLLGLLELMQSEVAPISDARGTSSYKRLLLRQLVIAHFLKIDQNILEPTSLIAQG